ncbi:MAG: hypothetical protein AB2L20_08250 [Mangrovibacterium sp.]
MKRSKLTLIVICVAAFMFNGCSHRVLDFTLISTKNVDLSKGASFERENTRVEGEDMVHWIISIPTGTINMKEAVDKAIESTTGCVALLDGVVYVKFWWVLLYGQQSVIVEGTPLIDPALAHNQLTVPAYGKIELARNGEVKEVKSISPDEFLAFKGKITKESSATKFQNSKEIE